jgi:hypothetical protein
VRHVTPAPSSQGIRHCLGVHVATAELAVALTVMARRVPNIHRAGDAPWRRDTGVSGPITLSVDFDRGPSDAPSMTAVTPRPALHQAHPRGAFPASPAQAGNGHVHTPLSRQPAVVPVDH